MKIKSIFWFDIKNLKMAEKKTTWEITDTLINDQAFHGVII